MVAIQLRGGRIKVSSRPGGRHRGIGDRRRDALRGGRRPPVPRRVPLVHRVEFQALDSLKLRATGGTIFRAPTVGDLFGGLIDSFPTFSDPCNAANFANSPGCAQVAPQLDNQVNSKIGGNPNLKPETGDTFTAGLVWQPTFGESISSLGVDFILNDCYVNQNDTACQLITRNPNYTINNILDASLNVAEQGATGIDTEIRWSRIGNLVD